MALSILLFFVGISGFFVNQPIFGIFDINFQHNLIHLLTGVVGMFTAWRSLAAGQTFARLFGSVYLLLSMFGFFVSGRIPWLIVHSLSDNFANLAIAAFLFFVGFMKFRPKRLDSENQLINH